jgi:hypothetical protein
MRLLLWGLYRSAHGDRTCNIVSEVKECGLRCSSYIFLSNCSKTMRGLALRWCSVRSVGNKAFEQAIMFISSGHLPVIS